MEQLLSIIDKLQDSISSFPALRAKSTRFCKQLESVKEKYRTISFDPQYQEVYDSLIEKGNMLLDNHFRPSMDAKQLSDNLTRYISYLNAAHGDFSGETKNITVFYRFFLLCSILIMLLAPVILSPIFALVFLIPIFFAVKGIKQRSKTGFLLSSCVGIAGLITSVLWLKYLYYVIIDYSSMLNDLITAYGFSPVVSQIFIIGLPILGVILFVLTICFFYHSYKVRNLFVA